MPTSIHTQEMSRISPVDALWALIQGQSKSVQKTIKHRLDVLYPAESPESAFAKTTSPDLKVRIEKGREEIRRNECVTVRSKEELDDFLSAL